MIIDGKVLAAERIDALKVFVAGLGRAPSLVILTALPTPATQQYLQIKKRIAKDIGIAVDVYEVDPHEGTEGALRVLAHALTDADGVVIQLPFPPSLAVEELLSQLPYGQDPDAIGVEAVAQYSLTQHAQVLPPVVAAIRSMCDTHHISLLGKRVVVVGQGRLVGVPAAQWFEQQGALVTRVTRESHTLFTDLQSADIVVLGAGVPSLLRPDMVREGVVIFDAGTSEEGGKVVGDADPLCAQKASFFTPVPGGIGPLAVAELFANVVRLRFDYKE